MQFNPKLYSVNCSGRRYVIHQGGTRSGKTYSILQFLVVYMLSHKGKRLSIVGQSLPHLKRGVVADLKSIIEKEKWNEYFIENKTNSVLLCKYTGSYVEFFSAASASKLRGPKRDILFINECNNVSWEAFRQLDVRTTTFTFLDFNPVNRFWVYNKLVPIVSQEEHHFLASTYRDNIFLTRAEIANIERQKVNTVWWKVFGEGDIGNPEGKVFVNWKIVPQSEAVAQAEKESQTLSKPTAQSLPGKILGYGVDFGFTHSPTAVVQVNEYEGEIWVKEHFYRTSTHSEELFNYLKTAIDVSVIAYADPSAPQTIEYLFRRGWRGLKAAKGGRDSVEFGLNLLLERVINVTSDSPHLIMEMEQYEWEQNKDGDYTSRPKKANDHAIDAMRYVISSPAKKTLICV